MPRATHYRAPLSITTQDEKFAEGFQRGYQDFIQLYQGTTISEEELHAFLAGQIHDIRHQPRYNSGYVLGWMCRLFQIDYRLLRIVVP